MSQNSSSLSGQHVVIIGGSTGIGFAAARLARQRGAELTVVGRNLEKLKVASAELGGARIAVADITQSATVARIFEEMSRVDHLVVAAGTYTMGRVRDADLSVHAHTVAERVLGPLAAIRAALPKMQGQGSITLMSGTLASRPFPNGTAVLGALCAASEALARGLALELAPIRVNALSPGWIDTPLLTDALGQHKEAVIAQASASLPGKRIGTAEEAAEAIFLLMTNGFINGEVLHVDGGGRYV